MDYIELPDVQSEGCVPCQENDTLCSVGITKTVYLGNTDTQNEANVDGVTHDVDRDQDHDVVTHDMDSDDDQIAFSTMNVQNQIEVELNSRKKTKQIDSYEFLSADWKELVSVHNGMSYEDHLIVQSAMRALISNAKAKKAKKNNIVTGNVVTCTTGNTKERYKRFRHKKQKLY